MYYIVFMFIFTKARYIETCFLVHFTNKEHFDNVYVIMKHLNLFPRITFTKTKYIKHLYKYFISKVHLTKHVQIHFD
jgi:hypothetical protein